MFIITESLITIITDQTLSSILINININQLINTNIKVPWFWEFFPIVFSFMRIWQIRLIDNDYRNIIQKFTVILAKKIPKKMFMYTRLKTLIFFVIIFTVIPSKSEINFSLTDVLFRAFFAS